MILGVQWILTLEWEDLGKIRDGPHEVAASQCEHAARPNQSIQNVSRSVCRPPRCAYVCCGPFGVANQEQAISASTMASTNTVGSDEDIASGLTMDGVQSNWYYLQLCAIT